MMACSHDFIRTTWYYECKNCGIQAGREEINQAKQRPIPIEVFRTIHTLKKFARLAIETDNPEILAIAEYADLVFVQRADDGTIASKRLSTILD